MMRRMAVGSVAAALIVLVVAGCGGSEGSPSPSAAATEEAPLATEEAPVATDTPSVEPSEAPATAGTVRLAAQCAGVGIRKDPATDAELVVRVAKGAKVRVVETVTGDPYEAGSCGLSGDDWLKIDRINGKSIKTLYGVSFGYAAGGFFK